VEAPRRELYDQLADPKAEHNLAPTSKAVADTLAAKTEEFHQKTTNKRELPKTVVDQSAQEKLAALDIRLGHLRFEIRFVGGTRPQRQDRDRQRDSSGELLFENGRFEDAIPVLEELVKKETGMAMLYGKLGGSYMKTHQYEKAVPVLRKAVELDPALTMAQMDLGRALLRTEDFNGAATVFETLLARMPLMLDAHLFLEVAYARAGRVPDTIKECEKVIEIMPSTMEAI